METLAVVSPVPSVAPNINVSSCFLVLRSRMIVIEEGPVDALGGVRLQVNPTSFKALIRSSDNRIAASLVSGSTPDSTKLGTDVGPCVSYSVRILSHPGSQTTKLVVFDNDGIIKRDGDTSHAR